MGKSYRDLFIWREAVDVAAAIVTMADEFPKPKCYALIDQIQRAPHTTGDRPEIELVETWRIRASCDANAQDRERHQQSDKTAQQLNR